MRRLACKICSGEADAYAEIVVRGHHCSLVYSCRNCSFVFIDPVYWLDEAYAEPITMSDVGYIYRNIAASEKLCDFLNVKTSDSDYFVDFGGGYGLLVRLMRDKGFRFHLHEPLVSNLFARACTANRSKFAPYRALTAIEVFEHLLDPLAGTAEMAGWSQCIVFTTELCPVAKPLPERWWYFGLEHGQHVSFYTTEALRILANRNGLQYFDLGGSWHAFALRDDPIVLQAKQRRGIVNSARSAAAYIVDKVSRRLHSRESRPSLLNADFDAIRRVISPMRQTPDGLFSHVDHTADQESLSRICDHLTE